MGESELDPREGLLGQASAKGLWFLGSVHRKGMILLLSDSVTSSFLELDGTVELLQDVQGWCRGNLRGGDGPRRMMRGTPPGGETAERCLRLGQAAARRMCSFFPWLYYFWYWTLTDVCLFQQNTLSSQ